MKFDYLFTFILFFLIIIMAIKCKNPKPNIVEKNEYKKYAINNYLLISTLTNNIIDSVFNFYYTEIINYDIKNYLFFATDEESYRKLKEKNINVVKYIINYSNSNNYDFSSKNYLLSTNVRISVILEMLKMNISVYVFDSDIKFFKNPLEYLSSFKEDIVIGCDNRVCDSYNTGQLYV